MKFNIGEIGKMENVNTIWFVWVNLKPWGILHRHGFATMGMKFFS
jgi:hypothetical protein